jgi:P27 family predicted phage terminase small subunit
MKRETPPAPAHLQAPGARFWRRIAEAFQLEPYHLDLLEQACEALDRAEGARERIDADGLTVLDRFGQVKANPLCAVERDARSQFRMLYRELGVNDDDAPGEIGRPPGRGIV